MSFYLSYNHSFHLSLGKLELFSDIAISLIFFSLGLGYSMESFKKNLKKTMVSSVIDLLNLIVPFVLMYILTKQYFISFTIALMVYPSSTAIIIKILESQKKLASKLADTIIGILLFEDIVLILVLAFLQASSQQTNPITTTIISLILIVLIYIFCELVLKKHSLILERYIQEEVGVFLILGFFLLVHFICHKFILPEPLIMFASGLLFPVSISNYLKPKIEAVKNFSIGLFILDFMLKTQITKQADINYYLLILAILCSFIKIITFYFSLKISKIKHSSEDIIYFLPRGEFTVYISKISNLEYFAFFTIILSNLIVMIHLAIPKHKK